ncbi:hypothetical protein CBR_g4114 [Chara braunii]|uniref:Uncharacterized protein n=1 Tax=Chara braunii TaxID=69332 RepID=A0A388KH78_CHABU|nr:hypothetical protein CBR_g4114 [Chara braunii]|eukprot:GBG69420.1 hypothetical protein CBR_g4114 [Chara braunii]
MQCSTSLSANYSDCRGRNKPIIAVSFEEGGTVNESLQVVGNRDGQSLQNPSVTQVHNNGERDIITVAGEGEVGERGGEREGVATTSAQEVQPVRTTDLIQKDSELRTKGEAVRTTTTQEATDDDASVLHRDPDRGGDKKRPVENGRRSSLDEDLNGRPGNDEKGESSDNLDNQMTAGNDDEQRERVDVFSMSVADRASTVGLPMSVDGHHHSNNGVVGGTGNDDDNNDNNDNNDNDDDEKEYNRHVNHGSEAQEKKTQQEPVFEENESQPILQQTAGDGGGEVEKRSADVDPFTEDADVSHVDGTNQPTKDDLDHSEHHSHAGDEGSDNNGNGVGDGEKLESRRDSNSVADGGDEGGKHRDEDRVANNDHHGDGDGHGDSTETHLLLPDIRETIGRESLTNNENTRDGGEINVNGNDDKGVQDSIADANADPRGDLNPGEHEEDSTDGKGLTELEHSDGQHDEGQEEETGGQAGLAAAAGGGGGGGGGGAESANGGGGAEGDKAVARSGGRSQTSQSDDDCKDVWSLADQVGEVLASVIGLVEKHLPWRGTIPRKIGFGVHSGALMVLAEHNPGVKGAMGEVVESSKDYGEKLDLQTCAVVGNGGSLLHSGRGSTINQHTAVFRLNQAPTGPYAEDVGTKTNIRFLNKKWTSRYGRRDPNTDFLPLEEGVVLLSARGTDDSKRKLGSRFQAHQKGAIVAVLELKVANATRNLMHEYEQRTDCLGGWGQKHLSSWQSLYMPEEEREVFARELEVIEDPLERQTTEDEKKLEWKLRMMREKKRRREETNRVAREVERIRPGRQEVQTQAEVLAKLDKILGYLEVLSEAWLEEHQANKGQDVTLHAIRSGFREFARDVVTHVETEVKKLKEGAKKFCVGAIESAKVVATAEAASRPRKEPVKLKFPDSYNGKKDDNFDNWESHCL